MSSLWYAVTNEAEIPSPALLLYPDRIEENLRRMIARAGDVSRLRPHVKTHKLPQVIALKRQLGIHKFKVSTIAEAEMTAAAGGEDILLAYQPVGPQIGRLITLIQKFPKTKFATIVDDPQNLATISRQAEAQGISIPLYIDLNVGMNRTGIVPGEAAHDLYRQIVKAPGVEAAGLHAYDGHLHNTDHAALKQAVAETFAAVWKLKQALEADGLPVPKIIASGTPTFPLLAEKNTDQNAEKNSEYGEIEVGCGTTVLWDFGQKLISPDLDFLNAAVLLCRVISKPTPDRLCLDLGHKAVAAEMPQPRVQFFGLEEAEIVTHSEEHLVLQTPQAAHYHVGDTVYGLPRHICPTVALHQAAAIVRDGAVVDHWPIVARQRKITV